MKDIITIDGPSGAGKSTISRLLAKRLGYSCLDTGALYRVVAWKVKEKGIDPDDEGRLKEILATIDITFDGERIIVGGTDITSEIRTQEIGELSSKVSAKPVVRERLYKLQREIGLKGMIVIEGRDIGTVIFPEAENKFFLDASPDERGRRRYKELKDNYPEISLQGTKEDLKKRDFRDSTRKIAPLKKTKGMIYIDTTNLTIEEVVSEIVSKIKK